MCHTGLTCKMKRSVETLLRIVCLPLVGISRLMSIGRDVPRVRRSARPTVPSGSSAVWR